VHQPLGPVDDYGHPTALPYQGAAVPKRLNKLGLGGRPGSGSLLFADPPSENAVLRQAAHADEELALTALRRRQNGTEARDNDGNGHHPAS
jgi:ubiquinol-cytochrome c reductase cytochrome b subunit